MCTSFSRFEIFIENNLYAFTMVFFFYAQDSSTSLFIFMCPSVCPCCSFLFPFFLYFIFQSFMNFPSSGETLITEVLFGVFYFQHHFTFLSQFSLFTEFNFCIVNWLPISFHLLLLLFELFDRSYNHSVEWFITMWLVTFSRHVLLVFHVPFISALGVVWIWSSLLVRCFSFSWNHRSFSLVMHSIQERRDFYWQLQVLSLVFWLCYYLSEQTISKSQSMSFPNPHLCCLLVCVFL